VSAGSAGGPLGGVHGFQILTSSRRGLQAPMLLARMAAICRGGLAPSASRAGEEIASLYRGIEYEFHGHPFRRGGSSRRQRCTPMFAVGRQISQGGRQRGIPSPSSEHMPSVPRRIMHFFGAYLFGSLTRRGLWWTGRRDAVAMRADPRAQRSIHGIRQENPFMCSALDSH